MNKIPNHIQDNFISLLDMINNASCLFFIILLNNKSIHICCGTYNYNNEFIFITAFFITLAMCFNNIIYYCREKSMSLYQSLFCTISIVSLLYTINKKNIFYDLYVHYESISIKICIAGFLIFLLLFSITKSIRDSLTLGRIIYGVSNFYLINIIIWMVSIVTYNECNSDPHLGKVTAASIAIVLLYSFMQRLCYKR